MRPDFRNFQGSGLLALAHSAKGTTWENHKYIKRIDGTYYYPNSYVGGRHLPSGSAVKTAKPNSSGQLPSNKSLVSKDTVISRLADISGMRRDSLVELYNVGRTSGYDSKEFKYLLNILSEGDKISSTKTTKTGSSVSAVKNTKSNKLEDWEETMYADIDAALKRNPGLFKLSQITDDNWQDFRLTLSEFAGIDTDKLSKAEVERMREKVKNHYKTKTSSSDKVGNIVKGTSGSTKISKVSSSKTAKTGEAAIKKATKTSKPAKTTTKSSTPVKKTSVQTKATVNNTKPSVSVSNAINAIRSTKKGIDYNKVFQVYRKKR